MPITNYTLSGSVKDVDGSIALAAGTVLVKDITQGLDIEGTVASDGSFAVNLANIEYANGDTLQVTIYDSEKTKITQFRHTVGNTQAGYEAGTLYMHWGSVPLKGNSNMNGLTVSNKDDSAEYTVDFYDGNDVKRYSVDVGPNTSFSPNLSLNGRFFEGGICVIRESDAANKVEVFIDVK